MSKPIEPGCLALVHGLVQDPQFNGMSVHVERWIRHGELMVHATAGLGVYRSAGGWLCSHPDWRGHEPFHPRNLMRLDGHEPVTTDETKEVPA